MQTINLIKPITRNYLRDKTSLFYGIFFNPAIYLIVAFIAKSRGYSDYGQKIFYGVLMMSILTIAIFNFPIMLSDFIERGVNKRLYIAPINMVQYFVSVLIPQLLMIVMSLIPLYLIGLIFEVDFISLSPLFIVFILLSSILLLAIALFIVSFFREITSLKAVSNLLYFYFLLLGDIFFSTENMSPLFKDLAALNPVHHLMSILNWILSSSSISTLNILVPVIWLVVAVMIFKVNFKKVMQYE